MIPRWLRDGLIGIAVYFVTHMLRLPSWVSESPGEPFRFPFQWLAFALDVNWQPVMWGLLAGLIPELIGWFCVGAFAGILLKKKKRKK